MFILNIKYFYINKNTKISHKGLKIRTFKILRVLPFSPQKNPTSLFSFLTLTSCRIYIPCRKSIQGIFIFVKGHFFCLDSNESIFTNMTLSNIYSLNHEIMGHVRSSFKLRLGIFCIKC